MRSIYIIGLAFFALKVNAQQVKTDTLESVTVKEISISSLNKNLGNSHNGNGHSTTTSLLERIPGVSLMSRGAFAQEAVLRGLNENQLASTINGMRVFSACTDRMDPASSYIEPNNLSKISVFPTNNSNSVGNSLGSINYKLNEANIDSSHQWSGNAATVWNSNNQEQRYLAAINYSTIKWAIHIDGIYRKANNYTPGGNKKENFAKYGDWTPSQVFTINKKGQVNFSQYSKWNIHANSKYKINQYSQLSMDYIQDEGHNIGYPALTMDVSYAKSHIASIDYNWDNSNNFISSIHTKIYYNRIDHAMDDSKRPSEQVSMHMDMPGKNHTMGNLVQLNVNISPTQRIEYQLESYLFKWNASMTMYPTTTQTKMFMLTIPDAQKWDNNLTITYINTPNTRWNYSIGGNIESSRNKLYTTLGEQQLSTIYANSSTKNYIPYNFFGNVKFQMNRNWHMQFAINSMRRSPMTKELYSIYLFNPMDNYDYIGNPDLQMEKIQHIDLSAHYQNKKIYSSLSVFGYRFGDYIAGSVKEGASPMTANAKGVKQYMNQGTAYSLGSEFTFKWLINNYFTFENNSSYQYGEDANKNALPLIQPFRNFTQITYHNLRSFDFFVSSQYAAVQNHVSSFYGETRTPSFIVFNSGVTKTFRWLKNTFQGNIVCNNILNKYYYEHLDVLKLPRIGRNIECSISYNF